MNSHIARKAKRSATFRKTICRAQKTETENLTEKLKTEIKIHAYPYPCQYYFHPLTK